MVDTFEQIPFLYTSSVVDDLGLQSAILSMIQCLMVQNTAHLESIVVLHLFKAIILGDTTTIGAAIIGIFL